MHGPFGLAAGFDKNAVAIDGMAMLGFDHVEIGTVTAQPQPGNPKKRLFRLVPDRALINRMGFNNEGSAAVAARLAARSAGLPDHRRRQHRQDQGRPGGRGRRRLRDLHRAARPRTPTTSSSTSPRPNTPGLRNLQAVEPLRPLLTAVREAADRTVTGRRVPLLVKIAPDLADEDVDAVADLAVELGLDGIIATNTTIAREGLGLTSDPPLVEETGGLSGAPAQGALPGGPAPPVRARGRPDHPRRRRRHRERRGRLAAHPRRRHAGPGLQRLHLRGPVLVPRDPQGPRRPPAQPARTPPSPTPSAPSTRKADRMTALEPFGARLRRAMDERGPLCVGIDPHASLLADWGLNDDVAGLERFTRTVVEALADRVAVLKPQSAFFERFGSRGIAVLETGRRGGAGGRRAGR